jgi:hypothetical protein
MSFRTLGPQPSASAYSATPTWMRASTLARAFARPNESIHQQAESHRAKHKYEGDDDRDPIQIPFGCCRAERRGASAAQHVGQATAPTAVQQNEHDQHENREDIDSGNQRDHGEQRYQSTLEPPTSDGGRDLGKMARGHMAITLREQQGLLDRTNLLGLPTARAEAATRRR